MSYSFATHGPEPTLSFPRSKGFATQEYWSGLPLFPPGDLPDPGIELGSPALAGGFFTTEPPESPWKQHGGSFKKLKIELPYDPTILLLGIYRKKKKVNFNLKRYMYPSGHSSTIYNTQDMEATQVPINRHWVKKIQ